MQAGQGRHGGPGAGGDDDGAGGEALQLWRCVTSAGLGNLDRPRVHDAGVATQHLHAQGGIALYAVMRRDGRNDILYPLHDRFEAENRRGVLQAVACAMLHFMRDLGAFDQGFARHAAVVEAVAAHFVGLNQRDFGFHGGGNIGRDQAPRTGANDDQVAVKLLRL